MRMRNYYAAVMLEQSAVDGLVTGLTSGYAASIRPSLEVVRTRPIVRDAALSFPPSRRRTSSVPPYGGAGHEPTQYGRIISLSSCSTMWQCQT
jgi:hypothetical protein